MISQSHYFSSRPKTEKLLAINSIIRELTFSARSVFAKADSGKDQLFHLTEMINRLCGYAEFLLTDNSDGDEALFIQMMVEALNSTRGAGAKRLLEQIELN